MSYPILPVLRSCGWDYTVHDVDCIIDVGNAMLCFHDDVIIGVYMDGAYMRVDDITVSDKVLMCYYNGVKVREVIKMM